MNDNATAIALASYAQGRNDGFKSGIVFGIGAIVLFRMWHKHDSLLRGKKNR